MTSLCGEMSAYLSSYLFCLIVGGQNPFLFVLELTILSAPELTSCHSAAQVSVFFPAADRFFANQFLGGPWAMNSNGNRTCQGQVKDDPWWLKFMHRRSTPCWWCQIYPNLTKHPKSDPLQTCSCHVSPFHIMSSCHLSSKTNGKTMFGLFVSSLKMGMVQE